MLYLPHTPHVARTALHSGTLNQVRATALLKPIPKGKGVAKASVSPKHVPQMDGGGGGPAALRFSSSANPRNIFDHPWHYFGEWKAMPEGISCPLRVCLWRIPHPFVCKHGCVPWHRRMQSHSQCPPFGATTRNKTLCIFGRG